ncbi:putative transcriptional regulator (plasmid) [Afipia carboxidovorans OM5]|uniref:Putative transcriptional regulator n=1 Tax=Afipia carboxidovorans (strain ATCC 49405 / DSM 1227 / KCTC 32145 / OM5) TaxID=504832 RepID=Q6LBC3_AFIC5|nr:autoinducer binding domain-containing protein [Afipia carboxidovorans]AEI04465.1 putative transcriptional regulator [Afipia carboxidovorans OM4]AEI08093.1 putative transcriptional regulator [Afipia carboxidovorans OM5]
MTLKDQALGFIEASRSARTAAQILDGAMAAVAGLEIEGMFVADVPAPGESIAPHILLRGWSELWIERYVVENYVHFDPVAGELKRRLAPFTWTEACNRRLSHHEQKVMSEARDFGLLDGVSVPVYDHRGRQSCVSFSGRRLKLDQEARRRFT